MLFQTLSSPDRTKTMMAYAAQFTLFSELNQGAESLIVWRKHCKLYKGQILDKLDSTMEHLYLVTVKGKKPEVFRIVWLNNNIPTEIEWTRKSSSYIISADFRVVNGIGPIVQLSF